ncbi:hypothetical protein Clacol_004192 [Clathrus columnatus]|uniref:Fido domain-containing protein n=1 Tax=Clathrus columnatus TaxID=1419009 RepID=A0AAV5A8H2_9AGAM|nr:hypothetical protein Clacol_004192 [Clathrus columnatus]
MYLGVRVYDIISDFLESSCIGHHRVMEFNQQGTLDIGAVIIILINYQLLTIKQNPKRAYAGRDRKNRLNLRRGKATAYWNILLSRCLDIPIDVLGSTLSSKLEKSLLVVDPSTATTTTAIGSSYTSCASSARFWESLLETHRVPYLLLRVADMRYVLKSKVTALLLYEELQSQLRDPSFEKWVRKLRSVISHQVQKQLRAYEASSLTYAKPNHYFWHSIISTSHGKGKTPSHSWPQCVIPSYQIQELLHTWNDLRSKGQNAIMAKFINLICLETNFLEGMFSFRPEVASTLVQVGFIHQIPLFGESGITGGAVRDHVEIMSILQDTRKALYWLNELQSHPSESPLTIDTLLTLHKTLMKTGQILNIHSLSASPTKAAGTQLKYTNIGETRQTTGVNLTGYRLGFKLDFCPHDKVNDELRMFCELYNELIRRKDIDPFAAAAWIIHNFLMIHPFGDGNSRLSRILASVPLMNKGLPPLCIPYSSKNTYLSLLNSMRESKDSGETCYEGLMGHLYEGMKVSLNLLRIVR